MPDKIAEAFGKMVRWIKQPQRLLDFVGVLLAGYLLYLAWSFAGQMDLVHIILVGMAVTGALKIIYELTINRVNVPTLASGYFVRRKMVEVVQRDAAARGAGAYTAIDLGSGRGELTRHIARTLPQARVLGVERRLFPCMQARIWQLLFGPKNLEYRRGDFLTCDCTTVDAVVMYLNTRVALQAGAKLRRELKPGAMVVSNTFELGEGWTAAEKIILPAPLKGLVWVYYQKK